MGKVLVHQNTLVLTLRLLKSGL